MDMQIDKALVGDKTYLSRPKTNIWKIIVSVPLSLYVLVGVAKRCVHYKPCRVLNLNLKAGRP